jgi:hypothetical protein
MHLGVKSVKCVVLVHLRELSLSVELVNGGGQCVTLGFGVDHAVFHLLQVRRPHLLPILFLQFQIQESL